MLPGHSRSFAKFIRAKFVHILSAVLVVAALASVVSAQTDNWVGSTGVWSDVTQWDSGVPVAGENIVIGTASASSTDDFSISVAGLNLASAGDFLTIADGVNLTVAGTVANSGTIQLNSAGTNTYLTISGSQTLTESGNVILGSAGLNYIQGASGTGSDVLTSSNVIQGMGSIGNGLMGFVNQATGTVNANTSGGNLFINVSAANFNNLGTLEATSGGNLTIEGPTGSFLNYARSTSVLSGGTYTANGGNIYFTGTKMGILSLSARVTQEASGQIINTTTGANALANLKIITATGVLTTTAGFTQPGSFSMAGALNILPSTVINVGSVTQIVNHVLNAGQWVLDSSLNITGTPQTIVTNSATMTLSGGTFKNKIDGSDAFATLQSNTKTLRVLNFAHFTTLGSLNNSGQMTVAKGCTLSIGGSGTSYSQTGGKTTFDGLLQGAGNITGGSFLGAGSLTGNFSVGGGSTNATFSIGDAGKAGQMKIVGAYTQLTNGILSVAIGGTTVITQYSQLKPSGAATLGGTLSAPLIGGFIPTVGQTFTVLSAKSVTGTFSNSTIAINSSEHFAVSYTANSAILTVASGPAAE